MTEYIAIIESNLELFKSLLLPQLHQRLQQMGDSRETENGTLLALGALRDGEPTGALVAILEQEGDIELLSLLVAQQHRRSGVATGLVDRLLRVASGCYMGERDGEANCIMLRASYLLTAEQLSVFRPFLERVGFDTFVEEGFAYSMDSTALRRCHLLQQAFQQDAQLDANLLPLVSLMDTERLALLEDGEEDFMDDSNRDWSYCYRKDGKLTDLLLAERGYGDSIVLRERAALDGSDSRSLLALLRQLLHTALGRLGEFRLFIESDDVLEDDEILDYLKKHGATQYNKQLAWGQVML